MIRIGLLGATGRMGQWVQKLIETEFGQKAQLAARAGQNDPLEPLLDTDVVIDFSLPVAMRALAAKSMTRKTGLPAFVVGSTGWKLEERHDLEELSKHTPVLMSSNYSTGVMALLEVLRQAAPMLEKIGYTPVLVETHHRHKKDAPSGTALSLQRAISPTGPGNVQTHCIRAGEIIGDHEVTFYGPGDHLTLGHFAQDRSIFARGAIDAALWLADKRGQPSMTGKIIGIETFFKERYL